MIDVDDWAEVRRLHKAEGMGVRAIARQLGISRNTVRSAIRSDGPPIYVRSPRGSIVDAVEPDIRALLSDTPTMPATVVAERIGWERSIRVLRGRVSELRPLFLPPDPCQRTEYLPGELAQWDLWFPDVDIPIGYDQVGRFPAIVGVSGYSRVIVGRLIPSREAHDVLLGHLCCLVDLGAVPRRGVYDQEPAIGRWRGTKQAFTEAFQGFRGTLGMGATLCARGDPEAKGLVERANGYLETSFLPGRSFESPEDFNAQLTSWLTTKANRRIHRSIRCRPSERLSEDLASMLALPPILPDPSARFSTRLGRDHYIRFGTNDYSVHPKVIGRRVDVSVDLEWVVVTCSGQEVARHRRSWAKHRTITTVEHHRARTQMRADLSVQAAEEIDVELRDLARYDQVLGVA